MNRYDPLSKYWGTVCLRRQRYGQRSAKVTCALGGEGRGNQPLLELSRGLGALDGGGGCLPLSLRVLTCCGNCEASWFGFDSFPSFPSPPFCKSSRKSEKDRNMHFIGSNYRPENLIEISTGFLEKTQTH